MNIVRGTVQNWTSLEEIKKVFEKKGFSDIENEQEGFLVNISEELREFLKVIVIKDDISKYYRYLEGSLGIEYLLLIDSFSEFTFVRQKITTLGKKKIEKFKFYRDDPKNSSIIKLNALEFEKVETFENLFDTKAVVDDFYKEYKEKRTKLVSKIQSIKEKEDKEKYAQVIFDRLIFLHFIQYKGFLCGNHHFLFEKFKEVHSQKKNYFEDFMKFLFFELLNKPNNQRSLKHAEFFDIPFLNGGLFREHRIELENPKIWISNDILGDILQFLDDWYWYVDESSDFGEDKALSPEILGHIFEKTITGQKEKGAYYTPEPITRYISENTIFPYCVEKINEKFSKNYKEIKEILHKKNFDEISYLYFDVLRKISVLDNAVGSGAFLLAAQKVLLTLYEECWDILKEETDSLVKAEVKAIEKHKTPEYHFKKWIISHNLYGVDIEEGAIEICKLRLWLSLVSEFIKETIEPLPNIDYNVMCGNSLIGYIEPPKEEQVTLNDSRKMSDILKEIHKLKEEFSQEEDPKKVKELKKKIDSVIEKENENLNDSLFGELTHKGIKLNRGDFDKLNPFHWGLKFHEKFTSGGFDVIVGNPPYVRADTEDNLFQVQRKTMEKSGFYVTLYEKWDLFVGFIERAINLLIKNGYMSFIISNSYNTSKYADRSKEWINKEHQFTQIDLFKNAQVFKGVGVESVIIFMQKSKSNVKTKRILHENIFDNFEELTATNNHEIMFRIGSKIDFTEKFNDAELLGDIVFISKGMVIHAEENNFRKEFKKDDLLSDKKDKIHNKLYLEAKYLDRYKIKKVKYLEWGTSRSPSKLSRPTFPELYSNPKIIRGRTTDGVFDDTGIISNESACVFVPYHFLQKVSNRSIKTSIQKWNKKTRKQLEDISKKYDVKYVLAVLNSKFAKFYLNTIRRHRLQFYFYPDDFKKLPIKEISKPEQQKFVKLVDEIISLNAKDKRNEEEIDKIDKQIDSEVYKLYGLSKEEIKIIEESVK